MQINEEKLLKGALKLLKFIDKTKDDPRFKNINTFVIKICLEYDEIPSIKECARDLGITERTVDLWINRLKEVKFLNKGIYIEE